MGIIDVWAENLFRSYGEKWVPIEVMRMDNKECIEGISKFYDVCEGRNQQTIAYINKESLFFKDYDEGLKKIKDKRIIYHNKTNKPLTFLVCGDNVLIEDTKQLFIKYHTKLLGKRLSERFDNIN